MGRKGRAAAGKAKAKAKAAAGKLPGGSDGKMRRRIDTEVYSSQVNIKDFADACRDIIIFLICYVFLFIFLKWHAGSLDFPMFLQILILCQIEDCHLQDWLNRAEGTYFNRSRLNVRRNKLLTCLMFATGWVPQDPKPSFLGIWNTYTILAYDVSVFSM